MSNTDNDTPKPAESGPLDLSEYPEIDIQVAKKLGWTDKDFALLNVFRLPNYSTEWGDVHIIVDFIEAKFGPCLELTHYEKGWLCEFRDRKNFRKSLATGREDTAPLAICKAFLNLKLEEGQE